MKKSAHWSTSFCGSQAIGSIAPCQRSCRLRAPYVIYPLSSWIGRVAVIFAFLAFFAAYTLGMAHFGWWLGFWIGWLPAAMLAWLIAQGFARSSQLAYRPRSRNQRDLDALMPDYAPSCCRGKVNKSMPYRRQCR